MSEAREDAVAHKPDGLWPALVAGAAASAVSRAITYPPDLVKAQLQIQGLLGHHGQHSLSTLQLSRQIANAEGAAGFYRGFGAVLAGVVPATMVYYAAYETSKKYVPDELGPLKGMTVGLMTQLAAGLAFTPVDIIKERMQAQRLMRHAYSYTGPAHAAASILRSQGAGGLLRGYWLTNAVWLPWNTLYIALYQQSKQTLAACLQASAAQTQIQESSAAAPQPAPAPLPGWAIGACSAASAAAAAVITHPLDVVKTRLQVGAASPTAAGGASSLQIARHLQATEGWQGFGRGLGARVVTIAPGAALQWFLYETIKSSLD
ncbi:hypothetical protein WJX74_006274 [Apatococcus lobatus]|uniref:Mitochondrial carrier protein n=1 Tax=Apatococcus lobatus TaxID=904363 RepID=A0AAW1QNH4_9CHLO